MQKLTALSQQVKIDEFIIKSIKEHFSSIFDIDALADEAFLRPAGQEPSPYFNFFKAVIDNIDSSDHVGSILRYLNNKQNNNAKFYVKQKAFVEEGAVEGAEEKLGVAEHQIGFMEKMATGVLTKMEPMSFFDMLRVVNNSGKLRGETYVLEYSHLNEMGGEKLRGKDFVFINMSKKSDETPRWAVIKPRQRRVFSEFLLHGSEKRLLKTEFDVERFENFDVVQEQPTTSGYAATIWSWHECDYKAVSMDSNYAEMRMQVGIRYFKGGGGGFFMGSTFSRCAADHKLFTPEYNHWISTYISSGQYDCGDYLLWPILRAVNIPIEGVYETNDACGFLKYAHRRNFSKKDFERAYQEGMKLTVSGLNIALKEHDRIRVEGDTTRFILDSSTMRTVYNDLDRIASKYNYSTGIIGRIPGNKLFNTDILPSTMLLTFFNTEAKTRKIIVDFDFNISDADKNIIRGLIQDNPFIEELSFTREKQNKIAEKMAPFLARNKWLRETNYRVESGADYWYRAAERWLMHLFELGNADIIASSDTVFIRCINDMELLGLKSFLDVLIKEEALVENLSAEQRPIFYAACAAKKTKAYIDMLVEHLSVEDAVFPFSQVDIRYQAGNDQSYIKLIAALNSIEDFDRITIRDVLVNEDATKAFLEQLIEHVRINKVSTLIMFPELDDKDSLREQYREIRALSKQLNNVILTNRREENAERFTENDLEPNSSTPIRIEPAKKAKGIKAFAVESWPLTQTRVGLQIQQEQQVEQEQQQEQEMITEVQEQRESPLTGELVDYYNINSLLAEDYKNYEDKDALVRSTTLSKVKDVQLQGLFRTWVNANLDKKAKHVLTKMTVNAARHCLRNHKFFVQGIDLEALPKGFYTQRNENDELVLCYELERDYAQARTVFTQQLAVKPLRSELWPGDFRQFRESLDKQDADNDCQDIILFEQLQPEKLYEEEYKIFFSKNAKHQSFLQKNRTFVLKHWVSFIQLWECYGDEGVRVFGQLTEDNFQLVSGDVLQRLLGEKNFKQYELLLTNITLTQKNLVAVGQIFLHYGKPGLNALFEQINKLFKSVGQDLEFIDHFKTNFIDTSQNCCDLVSEQALAIFKDMSVTMTANQKLAELWMAWVTPHIKMMGWDSLPLVWSAHKQFHSQLKAERLHLNYRVVKDLPIYNMHVLMARILRLLDNIADPRNKAQLLEDLMQADLTHGGAHYAFVYDHFHLFHQKLELHDFYEANNGYQAPMLLNNWGVDETKLFVRRALAQQVWSTTENFEYFTKKIKLRDPLNVLLTTELPEGEQWHEKANHDIETLAASGQLSSLANHLYRAHYFHDKKIQVRLACLPALVASGQTYAQVSALMSTYSHGQLLEAASIYWRRNSHYDHFSHVVALFERHAGKRSVLIPTMLKVATLFGVSDQSAIATLADSIEKLTKYSFFEVQKLFDKLLSVDLDKTRIEHLDAAAELAVRRIGEILGHFVKSEISEGLELCQSIIQELRAAKVVIPYNAGGKFRQLIDKDRPLTIKSKFGRNADIIWKFCKQHILIPEQTEEASVELDPLFKFLQKLETKPTAIDEIVQLLAVLDRTKENRFWTCEIFTSLLKSLDSGVITQHYPLSILKILVANPLMEARPVDQVATELPQAVLSGLRRIMDPELGYMRAQTVELTRALLTYFEETQALDDFDILFAELNHQSKALRSVFFKVLSADQNLSADSIGQRWQTFQKLLLVPHINYEDDQWSKICQDWLLNLTNDRVKSYFDKIMGAPEESVAPLLHIVAKSSFSNDALAAIVDIQEREESKKYIMTVKLKKLYDRLTTFTANELRDLAQLYIDHYSPDADDILRLIKWERTDDKKTWKDCLAEYAINPYPQTRHDYAETAEIRTIDLHRMLKDTRISKGHKKSFSTQDVQEILAALNSLKAYESGREKVSGQGFGLTKVRDLTREQLLQLLKAKGTNTVAKLAMLFEVLQRTSAMYPNLAQQLALIVNQVTMTSGKRVLQLATGEGKSICIALRAAIFALDDKRVDICTAKRSLASRDAEDFYNYFAYIGVKCGYLHPDTEKEDYDAAMVNFTTTGDLSLFLDRLSWEGIEHNYPAESRVVLLDEFDHIRFGEDRATQYNFASPGGRSPQLMTWIYETIIDFYAKHGATMRRTNKVTSKDLDLLRADLMDNADSNPHRLEMIADFESNKIVLVMWIRAAHAAAHLIKDVDFIERETEKKMGGENYKFKMIIPLSKDKQPMIGSTYSEGVQQLLGVRRNRVLVEVEGKVGDIFIPAESHILSSQTASSRMAKLWHRQEGFTGTVSKAQALKLYKEDGFEILHMPTNHPTLRQWQVPIFCADREQYEYEIARVLQQHIHEGKSVLLGCKDDRAVKAIHGVLAQKLTEEKDQLLPYTYDNPDQSIKQLLEEKRRREQHVDGRKQRGVGLLASGFGRGDNLDIEAVFVLDARDGNDRKQLGGRTGRFGNDGQVFTFYQMDAIESELKTKTEALKEIGPAGLEILERIKEKYDLYEQSHKGEYDNALILRNVLTVKSLLWVREELDNFNDAQYRYHQVLAQYCAWGMNLFTRIASAEDNVAVHGVRTHWATSLKHIADEWINILGIKPTTDAQEDELKRVIDQFAKSIYKDAILLNDTLDEFVIVDKLGMPVQPRKQALGSSKPLVDIWMRLVALGFNDQDVSEQDEICQAMTTLEDKNQLSYAAQSIYAFDTLADIKAELVKCAANRPKLEQEQIKKLEEQADEFEFSILQRDKLGKASYPIRQLLKQLIVRHGLDTDQMIEFYQPLFKNLNSLQYDEQKQFFEAWPKIRAESNGLLEARLALLPMTLDDFNRTWTFAHKMDATDVAENLRILRRALNGHPTQRLRFLTKAEELLRTLPVEKQQHLLKNFCKILSNLQSPADYQLLMKLWNKTLEWWNKGRHTEYHAELIQLWERITSHAESFSGLRPLVLASFAQPGKAWFYYLHASLAGASSQIPCMAVTLKPIVDNFAKFNLKKRDIAKLIEPLAKNLPLKDAERIMPFLIVLIMKNTMPQAHGKSVIPELAAFQELFAHLPKVNVELLQHIAEDALWDKPLSKEQILFLARIAQLPLVRIKNSQKTAESIRELLRKPYCLDKADGVIRSLSSCPTLLDERSQWHKDVVSLYEYHDEHSAAIDCMLAFVDGLTMSSKEELLKEVLRVFRLVDKNDEKIANVIQLFVQTREPRLLDQLVFFKALAYVLLQDPRLAECYTPRQIIQVATLLQTYKRDNVETICNVLYKFNKVLANVFEEVADQLMEYFACEEAIKLTNEMTIAELTSFWGYFVEQCAQVNTVDLQMERFQESHLNVVNFVNYLRAEKLPEHHLAVRALLFSNVTHALVKPQRDPAIKSRCMEVAKIFFQARVDCEVDDILSHAGFQHMFDFRSAEQQQKRVIFMFALYHGSFLSQHRVPKDASLWSNDNNAKLLEQAMAKYQQHIVGLHEGRTPDDVLLHQQLFQLAYEFKVMSRGYHKDIDDIYHKSEALSSLKESLLESCAKYEASSKTGARKVQFKQFFIAVGKQFPADQRIGLNDGVSRYQRVVELILAHKKAAIEADNRENAVTNWWAPINSDGSPYYQVLRTMEQVAMCAWSRSLRDADDFGVYCKFVKNDVKLHIKGISDALPQSIKRSSSDSISRKLIEFFRGCLADVYDRTGDSYNITRESLQQLRSEIAKLNEDAELPGEIRALFVELEAPLEVLLHHLEAQQKCTLVKLN